MEGHRPKEDILPPKQSKFEVIEQSISDVYRILEKISAIEQGKLDLLDYPHSPDIEINKNESLESLKRGLVLLYSKYNEMSALTEKTPIDKKRVEEIEYVLETVELIHPEIYKELTQKS